MDLSSPGKGRPPGLPGRQVAPDQSESRQATAAVVRCFVGTFSRVRVPSQRTGPRQQPGMMAGGRRTRWASCRSPSNPHTRPHTHPALIQIPSAIQIARQMEGAL